MPPHFFPAKSHFAFAPGDQVIRYVDGTPVPCSVITVIDEEQILIRADQWPMGYSAPVRTSDVVLVARKTEFGLSA